MTTLLQVVIYGLAVGAVYGLIALGFVLVFKTTGAFNLAQGELLMFLAYICMSLSVQVGIPFYLALVFTLVIAVLLGFIFERVLLRPLTGKPVTTIIMMTIALAIIVRAIAMFIWSYYSYKLPTWLPAGELVLGPLALSWDYIASFFVVCFILLLFLLYFKFARFSLAMRAVGEDQSIAQILGIRLNLAHGLAWAFGLVVAAIGGVILGTLNSVSYTLGSFGLFVIPVIIIGGINSIPGALVGGILVGVAEKVGSMYLSAQFPGISLVIPYILALIILYIKPAGIWGEKNIERI